MKLTMFLKKLIKIITYKHTTIFISVILQSTFKVSNKFVVLVQSQKHSQSKPDLRAPSDEGSNYKRILRQKNLFL